MILDSKNKTSEYFLSRIFLGLIVVLTVFDGISIFSIPVLNTLLFLCAPFVLRYLKLNYKNKADSNLILFLYSYLLLIIIIVISGVLYGTNILFDARAAVTNIGFILQIVIIFFYVKRIGDVKSVLYPMSLAMGVYALLNILCIIGIIEPLESDLRNEMAYISDGFLSDLIVGKGLYFYMTNGNYSLLTIFAISSCIILIDHRKDYFFMKLLLKFIAIIILLAGLFIQSRALLLSLTAYLFLILITSPKNNIKVIINFFFFIAILIFIFF